MVPYGLETGFGVDYSPWLKSLCLGHGVLFDGRIVDSGEVSGLHNLHGHPSPRRSAGAGIGSR